MKFVIITFLLLFSTTVFSQADILTIDGAKYYYNGKEYKCKDLGPIYQESEKANEIYKNANLSYNISNIMAVTGMVSLGVGIGFAASDKWLEATSFFAGTVVLGLASLIPRTVGDQQMGNAKDAFNFDMIERHGYNSDTTLSFESNENGISLVLNF